MGTWVAIAIGMFVLGSIMALKPSTIDVRLDKLRMSARRLELNPKLIACPDWVRGTSNEYGQGMIGQYSLVLDDMKLPETRYQVIDGVLRSGGIATESDIAPSLEAVDGGNIINDALDKEVLGLPEVMVPLIKAVYSKANSIVIFWHDSGYVKPSSNPNYNAQQIESDLLALKKRLNDWAIKLSKKQSL